MPLLGGGARGALHGEEGRKAQDHAPPGADAATTREALVDALAILAIVVSVGAILLGFVFYQMQKQQGERIAMAVMSTVDQLYRRTSGPGLFEDPLEYGVDPDPVNVGLSPKFLRPNEITELLIDAALWQDILGVPQIEFVVERPSGRRDTVVRQLIAKNGSFHLRLPYPSESFEGSTSDPGRYHVAWNAADTYSLLTPRTGATETRSEHLGAGSDSFYVLP